MASSKEMHKSIEMNLNCHYGVGKSRITYFLNQSVKTR